METVDDSALRTILLERISGKGAIPFADFMQACLYEPGFGYYTSAGRKVGAEVISIPAAMSTGFSAG